MDINIGKIALSWMACLNGVNLWFEIPRHCGTKSSDLDGAQTLSSFSGKQIEFPTICYFEVFQIRL